MARKLVFLPGVGADPDFWRPLGERLPAAWQRVYLGWPGLGQQPHDPAVQGRHDLLRLVEAAIGDGPADLLAQSMGGVLAIQAALRQPAKVRRLVLTVTSGGVDMAGLGATNWRDTYRRNHPGAPPWVFEPWGDPDIEQVRQPTLLIWGDADPISPVAVGERLVHLLPDATLRVVAGGDHGLAQSRPDEIAPWIEAHLA